MNVLGTQSKEVTFWDWFSKNENNLFYLEKDQERLLDSISSALNEYEDGLVFEISNPLNGKRKFIISADGISELFPSVQALSKAAPVLDKWEVIAFRPRMEDYQNFKIDYAGNEIDASKIWIYYRIQDGFFDLIIYHPEYTDEERDLFVSASYILLDMALGEYNVTTGIRYIDHQRLPADPTNVGLLPFSELRNAFDSYNNK